MKDFICLNGFRSMEFQPKLNEDLCKKKGILFSAPCQQLAQLACSKGSTFMSQILILELLYSFILYIIDKVSSKMFEISI